jgi:hypothetical protein
VPERTIVATILHDTEGRLAAPLARAATALRSSFSGFAASLTEATDPRVARVLQSELGALITYHPVGEAIIGRARRDAVRLALDAEGERVLYSDIDHILRWIEADEDEMATCLAADPATQFLIIGRTGDAMQRIPARLRDTEMPVNKVYELMSGRRADLLFAIRRMDRDVAADVVRHSRIDTIANDVEWPLLAERLGYRVGYAAAHGLSYRTIDEYGADADSYDGDALQWIRRIEMAGEMARAMRLFLNR